MTLFSLCNDSREKQHLLDGTSPNVAACHPRWTLEAHCVLLHLSVYSVRQVNNKHFSFEIDFGYFRPSKVLNALADRERANAWKIYANVELSSSVIFHWMWIDTVSLETSRDYNEFIVHHNSFLSWFSLPMRLDNFLFQLQWLAERKFQCRNVIFGVNFPVIVAEFV